MSHEICIYIRGFSFCFCDRKVRVCFFKGRMPLLLRGGEGGGAGDAFVAFNGHAFAFKGHDSPAI
jgi:hypothetical protein